MQPTEEMLTNILVKAAQRAEHAAAQFPPDSKLHERWHRIAEGYRQLARQTPETDTKNKVH